MALVSVLFRGNGALERCAIHDAAHVTRGATGDHVAKIQLALFALDGLKIDQPELLSRQYGRSTASAVKAYKTKRQIINRSYQNAPDDIVGKMTIASLDKDMRRRELAFKPPGDCAVAPPGFSLPGTTVSPVRSLAGSNTRNVTAPRQLGGFIRVVFQTTLGAPLFPLSANIEKARDLLFEHGITLSVEIKTGFADTLPFPSHVLSSFGSAGDNVDDIRQMSESVRPGLPGVLRVIVCQVVGDHAGDTFRGRVINGRIVPPFVLMNADLIDLSHATLIHEMIHVSKPGFVQHDPEKFSVFFEHSRDKLREGVDRTMLKAEHALTLSTMSSKL